MTQLRYVDWFRAAAPYIHAHRGRTFVVHLSGESLNAASNAGICTDLALLRSLGVRLVLVHGARPQIDQALAANGLQPRYAQGLRITDAAAMQAVKETVGATHVELEARLSMGVANSPMAGAHLEVVSGNVVTARPLGIRDGIDFQFTGAVRRVDRAAVERHLATGAVVLVSPIGYSPTGEAFNLFSEDLAAALAIEIHAAKLLYVAPGASLNDVEGNAVRELSLADARELLKALRHAEGVEPSLALLEQAVHACLHGVERVQIVDADIDGALLLELYTRDGLGGMVSAAPYDRVRRAKLEDVGGILELIEPLERAGSLVRRSREKLENDIENFLVVERDGTAIACAALYPFIEDRLVELACLAVHDEYRNRGCGDLLFATAIDEARALGAERLFVLSTQATHWFKERGFHDTTLDELPVARQRLYNYQRGSKVLICPVTAGPPPSRPGSRSSTHPRNDRY